MIPVGRAVCLMSISGEQPLPAARGGAMLAPPRGLPSKPGEARGPSAHQNATTLLWQILANPYFHPWSGRYSAI
jgi:hypothetical protein